MSDDESQFAEPGATKTAAGAPSCPESRTEAWCVVVAGGSGARFGRMKQFEDLDGLRVIDRSVNTAASVCDGVVVVIPVGVIDTDQAGFDQTELVVAGGSTRAESVRAGLVVVPTSATLILVHDAARPLATPELYDRVIDALVAGARAVVPVVPVVDTLRRLEGGTLDRESVRAVQTPQGFEAEVLRAAHETNLEGTDDASLVETAGVEVTLVDGESANIKLTTPADLAVARALMSLADTEPVQNTS